MGPLRRSSAGTRVVAQTTGSLAVRAPIGRGPTLSHDAPERLGSGSTLKKMLWRTLGVVRDRLRVLAGVPGCSPGAFRLFARRARFCSNLDMSTRCSRERLRAIFSGRRSRYALRLSAPLCSWLSALRAPRAVRARTRIYGRGARGGTAWGLFVDPRRGRASSPKLRAQATRGSRRSLILRGATRRSRD